MICKLTHLRWVFSICHSLCEHIEIFIISSQNVAIVRSELMNLLRMCRRALMEGIFWMCARFHQKFSHYRVLYIVLHVGFQNIWLLMLGLVGSVTFVTLCWPWSMAPPDHCSFKKTASSNVSESKLQAKLHQSLGGSVIYEMWIVLAG